MSWEEAIWELTEYGIRRNLIQEEDRWYTINQLLSLYGVSEFHLGQNFAAEKISREGMPKPEEQELSSLLDILLEEAVQRGLLPEDSVTYRDLFDTRLMGCLTPRPSTVISRFRHLYEKSPELATDDFYSFSQNTNYIRRDRIRRDIRWKYDSSYGRIDMTINLSKPEKDPKAIAAAGKQKARTYPACQLCRENEGYAGRLDHPARQNHRIIPLTLGGEPWGFQYSPYVYYQEHCIVLHMKHTPMKLDRHTFVRLFDFLRQFPHYFIGSNGDLPIVGGSILSHEHFQGGRYSFAMEEAPLECEVSIPGYEDVQTGILKWPVSVLRLRSRNPQRLIALADHILQVWRGYSDPEAQIIAQSEGEPHNTLTPIARIREGCYELDLALRNNRTTPEYPLGIFHPHFDKHHIKKENIGLIEVMGMAILPARLKTEMEGLILAMLEGKDLYQDPMTEKHAAWAEDIRRRRVGFSRETADEIIQEELGRTFVQVLEDAGVYKCTPKGRQAFRRFIAAL